MMISLVVMPSSAAIAQARRARGVAPKNGGLLGVAALAGERDREDERARADRAADLALGDEGGAEHVRGELDAGVAVAGH
jgi:hypothetical protein